MRSSNASWALAAHGSFDRMQLARRAWGIAPMWPRTATDGHYLKHAYPLSNAELPFEFGYGATAKMCHEAAVKHNGTRVVGDGERCHGVLLAAWRM